MSISVSNISKRSFTFNLRAGVDYGEEFAPKPHTQMIDRTTKDGKAGTELREVALPQSVTINPGDEVVLHDSVALIPEVQRAKRAGILRIEPIASPAPTAQPTNDET